MCLECSGRHRALGVHISFVRSVSMDSWSDKQIQMMRLGGNDKCNAFLLEHGVHKTMQIQQKYNTPAALLYKDRISAAVEGRPLPTALPKVEQSHNSGVAQGSDPLPGESEADYVARQRKLQEEARERMRAKFGGSKGLNASGQGGKLAGIGSDASYRPGVGEMGGINTAEVTAKLSEASKSAMSFLSSTVAALSEKVQTINLPPPSNSQRGYGDADQVMGRFYCSVVGCGLWIECTHALHTHTAQHSIRRIIEITRTHHTHRTHIRLCTYKPHTPHTPTHPTLH